MQLGSAPAGRSGAQRQRGAAEVEAEGSGADDERGDERGRGLFLLSFPRFSSSFPAAVIPFPTRLPALAFPFHPFVLCTPCPLLCFGTCCLLPSSLMIAPLPFQLLPSLPPLLPQ